MSESSLKDYMEELLIKFDQHVIFPAQVHYERMKYSLRRYMTLHPEIAELREIICAAFIYLFMVCVVYLIHVKFNI